MPACLGYTYPSVARVYSQTYSDPDSSYIHICLSCSPAGPEGAAGAVRQDQRVPPRPRADRTAPPTGETSDLPLFTPHARIAVMRSSRSTY
jgi:hypothetical protein